MVYFILILVLVFFLLLILKGDTKHKKVGIFGSVLAGMLLLLRLPSNLVLALLNIIPFILEFSKKRLSNTVQKTDNVITINEAYEILGVTHDASQKEIKDAFNKLIKKNHPDVGGSKYISAKLIAAKELLLKNKSRGKS